MQVSDQSGPTAKLEEMIQALADQVARLQKDKVSATGPRQITETGEISYHRVRLQRGGSYI